MGFLQSLLLLLALWLLAAWGLQRQVLFPAPRLEGGAPPPQLAPSEVVSLPGETEAWYLPAGSGPAPVLLFAHGNAELIDDWAPVLAPLRDWGLALMLVEYPGYGRSRGSPSQHSITAAMRAAADWLIARPEIDAKRMVGYGRSLGGGAICALAGERELSAIVLESSFTRVADLARRFGLFGPLIRDPFDNVAQLRQFAGPVLILHGRADTLIPPDHARGLQAAAPQAELQLLDCGHNDCPRPWPQLQDFLRRHGLLGGR